MLTMKKYLIFLLALGLQAGMSLPDYFRANFEQTVRSDDHNATLRYKGKLRFHAPDNARWDYETPVEKSICVQNARVWVIEPELEQATLFRLRQSIPLNTLVARAKPQKDGSYLSRFEGVDYRLQADTRGRPVAISYTDHLGNRVRIRFFHIETDPFDTRTLACRIPEGFDVIDGRY